MYNPLQTWRQWSALRAQKKLASAVASMDVNRVRNCLMASSISNPWMDVSITHAGLSKSELKSLDPGERIRALDFILGRLSRHPLQRMQANALAIAVLLLEKGARVSDGAEGAPLGSLALIQLKDIRLLKLACEKEPLWEKSFSWFSIVQGSPMMMPRTYEEQCINEGWLEGAEFLHTKREKERAIVGHDILDSSTAPAISLSSKRRPQRL